MSRRLSFAWLMPGLVIVSFILGSTYNLFLPGGRTARKVSDVADHIRRHYPGDIPAEKLERAAIDGMLNATDAWSQYFTAAEWREWSGRVISGKIHGVGIRVEADPKTGYIRVLSPMENSPAFDAGILPGDQVIKVDGQDIRNRSLEEITGRIKGDQGTNVVLTIRRGETDVFDVTLTRAEIKVRAVKHRMAAPGLGYIRIDDFTEGMPADVGAALKDLETRKMEALVVDLRFNGGGLLRSAVELCDFWLPSGKVVTKSEGKRAEYRRSYETLKDDAPAARYPLVILVNRFSASASEVAAGALRDHGLATLVGSRTFGKGLVQSNFELSDGSVVKLTTSRWLTPNGELVSARSDEEQGGLIPAFLVEMSEEEEGALVRRWVEESVLKGPPLKDPPPRDYVLEAGLEVLRAKLENRPPNVERREVPKAAEKK